MAELGIFIDFSLMKKVLAVENTTCQCCNPDGQKTNQGIIKKDEEIMCLNGFRRYIKRCNGEPIIPRELRTSKTREMDPADFRYPIKARRICLSCFQKLQCLLNLNQSVKMDVGLEFKLTALKPIYYSHTASSQRDYYCMCESGKKIPKGSSYTRIGNYDTGCICSDCCKILGPFLWA